MTYRMESRMKKTKMLIVMILCLTLLSGTMTAAAAGDDLTAQISETASGLSAMGGAPGTMLADRDIFPAGNSLNDWIAHALSLSGSREYYSQYLDALKEYVEKEYAANGSLHEIKATEYHRIALTVMALGGDPTSFGTGPDGTSIDLIADGTYNFIGRELGLQGLNGWIWALITLDASGAEVPADAKYQRSDMVNAILAAQEPDGGFGLDIGRSSIDITAMALQALSPYFSIKDDVINEALCWLSLQMNDDCTFSGFDSGGSESVSQVIMALCALGLDPEAPTVFVHGDHTLLTALESFRQPDGTYAHLLDDGEGNGLATCQAIQALLSLRDFHRGTGYVFAQGYNVPDQNEDPIPAKNDTAEHSAAADNGPALAADAAVKKDVNIGAILVIPAAIAVLVPLFILLRRRSRSSAS